MTAAPLAAPPTPVGAVDVSTQLATNLLRNAPSSAVTDALLSLAHMPPTRMGAAPSREVAQALLADRHRHPMLASAPLTDPDILTSMARSGSHTLVPAAAANPHTPPHVREEIARTCLNTGDHTLAVALAATIDPTRWILEAPVAPGSWQTASAAVHNVLHLLERHGDPEEVLAVAALAAPRWHRMHPLTGGILYLCCTGRLPVDVQALMHALTATSDPNMSAIVSTALHQHEPLEPFTVSFATMLAAHLTDSQQLTNEARSALKKPRPASPDVTATLLAGGEFNAAAGLIAAAALGRAELTDTQVDDLVSRPHHGLKREMLERESFRQRMTRSQLERACRNAPRNQGLLEQLLHEPDRLTAAAQIDVLRAGNATLTGRWISGQLPTAPTATGVLELGDNPGYALSTSGSPATAVVNTSGPSGLVRHLVQHFTMDSLHRPGVTAVLDQAGEAVLGLAATRYNEPDSNPFLAYLSARITDRFADDARAWLMIATLAEAATYDTVTALLDITEAMLVTNDATTDTGAATGHSKPS